MIADWSITRDDTARFDVRSQQFAAKAWAAGQFDAEIAPIEAPVLDKEGNTTGTTRTVPRDGGLRRPRSRPREAQAGD